MNGVLLQAFHWYLQADLPLMNGRKLWSFLRNEAEHLRDIGIDAVWIPPAYRGADSGGVGYDVYDHYNIGEFPLNGQVETRYGTKEELHRMIEALHGDGREKRISVYADIVINHRAGGSVNPDFWEAIRVEKDNRTEERWGEGWQRGKIEITGYTNFTYPERANMYSAFKWNARHFDSIDTVTQIRQNGEYFTDDRAYIYRFLYNEEGYIPHLKNFDRWVDLEKGNFDFLTSCDIDYGRPDVREEIKVWGEWFIREFNFEGVRLDAVKHVSAHYIQEWVGHVRAKLGKDVFAVAEYISGGTQKLHDFISEVSTQWEYPQQITVFDFPLFFQFNTAGKMGEAYDLGNLFKDNLTAEQPALSVTFVENHDYEFGRGWQCHVEAWFKPLAYAFILLRQRGFPCLFFPDYYGSTSIDKHKGYLSGSNYLDLLLKLRKQFALGEELDYVEGSIAGWTRLGFTEGAKGCMAVVINIAYNRVQSIRMNTLRKFKQFYHLATLKWTEEGYLVARGAYSMYGNKEAALWTDEEGWGEFVADGGSVSIWIEDGVGLQ
jgi:alpha-amylase